MWNTAARPSRATLSTASRVTPYRCPPTWQLSRNCPWTNTKWTQWSKAAGWGLPLPAPHYLTTLQELSLNKHKMNSVVECPGMGGYLYWCSPYLTTPNVECLPRGEEWLPVQVSPHLATLQELSLNKHKMNSVVECRGGREEGGGFEWRQV